MATIANIHPAGDGGWFWYAMFLRGGHRLYADLHLALQPLFVLETSWFLALLGKGWLVSKIPAVLNLVAYCLGLLLLVRPSELADGKKAIFLGCAFFVSISVEAFRFDDYHVLTDCFQLYSLLLLLRLQASDSVRRSLGIVAALGILSGLALTTRLNDGGAMALGVAIAMLCLARTRQVGQVVLFGAVAALTAISIVGLTGDSLHDYAVYSILRAAGSKGGAGSVLAYPLHLPLHTLRYVAASFGPGIVLLASLAVCAACVFLIWPLRRGLGWLQVVKATVGVTIVQFLVRPLYGVFLGDSYMIAMSAFGVLALYLLGALVVLRWLRSRVVRDASGWNPRESLMLIPLGQLMSASMSSGGIHAGLYGPLAVAIVLLPIASPVRIASRPARSLLYALAGLMAIYGAVYKVTTPYSWHSYQARPLFVGRQWYRHPDYGPMLIDSRQLAMMQRICSQVKSSAGAPELLSLPFSYADYFCAIPPWHGYVQTFFDTTTRETIFGLIDELQASPPQWIVYQRQLDSMTIHEELYNRRQPLAHRSLDDLIEAKIARGEWVAVYRSDYGQRANWSNEWILIRTRP